MIPYSALNFIHNSKFMVAIWMNIFPLPANNEIHMCDIALPTSTYLLLGVCMDLLHNTSVMNSYHFFYIYCTITDSQRFALQLCELIVMSKLFNSASVILSL